MADGRAEERPWGYARSAAFFGHAAAPKPPRPAEGGLPRSAPATPRASTEAERPAASSLRAAAGWLYQGGNNNNKQQQQQKGCSASAPPSPGGRSPNPIATGNEDTDLYDLLPATPPGSPRSSRPRTSSDPAPIVFGRRQRPGAGPTASAPTKRGSPLLIFEEQGEKPAPAKSTLPTVPASRTASDDSQIDVWMRARSKERKLGRILFPTTPLGGAGGGTDESQVRHPYSTLTFV